MAGKIGMHHKLLNPAAIAVLRLKIDSEKIILKLTKHILNNDEMTSSQVAAALGLLKKTTPDLSSVTMDVQGTISHEVLLSELK